MTLKHFTNGVGSEFYCFAWDDLFGGESLGVSFLPAPRASEHIYID